MSDTEHHRSGALATAFKVILPLAVLGAALYGGHLLISSPPAAEAKKDRPARSARLVEVMTIPPAVNALKVEAMGTVRPTKMIELRPRVNGFVTEMNSALIPGGVIKKDEAMMTLDPADFELTVRQREADVASARSALELEKAQQATAREELELIGQSISEEEKRFVLRQPQLANLEAQLQAAEARLAEAQASVDRTKITAPFNAVVIDRTMDVGSQVGPSTTLATIAGSDSFWVEFQVPTDELRWITFPDETNDKGSKVIIRDDAAWQPRTKRIGHVIGLSGELESGARTAKVLVEVADPLALNDAKDQPRLLLNSFVHGDILGPDVPHSVRIPRDYLRPNNIAWVMNNENKLEVRKLTVTYIGREDVIVSEGLSAGEKLITSRMRAAVDGMELRVDEPEQQVTVTE